MEKACGAHLTQGSASPIPVKSMIIAGSSEWTDYSVRVDVDVDGAIGTGEASLLIRATQPAYHPDQVRDSVVAYAVTVKEGGLSLEKLNYGSVTIARVDVDTHGTRRAQSGGRRADPQTLLR